MSSVYTQLFCPNPHPNQEIDATSILIIQKRELSCRKIHYLARARIQQWSSRDLKAGHPTPCYEPQTSCSSSSNSHSAFLDVTWPEATCGGPCYSRPLLGANYPLSTTMWIPLDDIESTTEYSLYVLVVVCHKLYE